MILQDWKGYPQLAQNAMNCTYFNITNQSISLFVWHDITAQLQQAEFGTGQTGHEVHLQLSKQ